MKDESQRRGSMPYRVLLVLIIAAMLALMLAAFYTTSPLTTRPLLLIIAGLLLIIAVALEIVFRDVSRLRERVRALEKERKP